MSKYFSMNDVPVGTKMKINSTGEVCTLVQIFNFPTTFKVEKEDGSQVVFKTHEVEIVEEKTN